MGLNGHQVYVWEKDADRVKDLIKKYVKEVGCAAAVGFKTDKVDPALSRRSQRTFVVSEPRGGVVCIWEDGSVGDRRLARYLSEQLETRAVWLALSSATDSWAQATYASGKVSDSGTKETDDFFEEAGDFAKRHKLPFAFIYLPDPNMASDVARFKQQFGEGWLHSEPE